MAIQVQLRRGTALAHSGFVGAAGEVTWITDEKRLVGHDAATVGGIKMARLDEVSSEVLRAVGNTSFSFQITDRLVVSNTAFTAPRTGTLPAANAVSAGRTISFFDTLPAINGANTLTIARAGSDTINGAASFVCAVPGARWDLVSDGVSRWSVTSFIVDGDRGDVIVSGSGATLTVDSNVITNAKLADMATARIKGRATAGDGDPEDLLPAQVRAVAQIDTWNGGRNLIINGDFRLNQRAFAGGALSAGVYGHDRWKADTGGANYSVSGRVATIASGSLVQAIEGASITSGTYVVSWEGSATCTVDGVAKTSGQSFALTAGTNCVVKFGAGTLGKVQIEPGVIPTAFEVRPYDTELMLCQRYYVRFGETTAITIGTGFAADTLNVVACVVPPRPMRVAPVSSVSAAVNILAVSAGGTAGTTSVSVNSVGSPGGRAAIDLLVVTSGSYTAGTPVSLRVAANNWLALDAEI